MKLSSREDNEQVAGLVLSGPVSDSQFLEKAGKSPNRATESRNTSHTHTSAHDQASRRQGIKSPLAVLSII